MIWDSGFTIFDLGFTIWDWPFDSSSRASKPAQGDNPFDTWILLFATVTLSLSNGMIWDLGFGIYDLRFGIGPFDSSSRAQAGSG
jgi:hypothetical protein